MCNRLQRCSRPGCRTGELTRPRGLGVTGAQQGVVGSAAGRGALGRVVPVGVVRCGAVNAPSVGQPDLGAASEVGVGVPGNPRDGPVALVANQRPRQDVIGGASFSDTVDTLCGRYPTSALHVIERLPEPHETRDECPRPRPWNGESPRKRPTQQQRSLPARIGYVPDTDFTGYNFSYDAQKPVRSTTDTKLFRHQEACPSTPRYLLRRGGRRTPTHAHRLGSEK